MREGRIGEVAAYCETDVVSTYRVWLVHESFRGRLSRAEFEGSEDNLLGFLAERVGAKPHLAQVVRGTRAAVSAGACSRTRLLTTLRRPSRRQKLSLLNDGLDRSVPEVGQVARSRARAASRCIQSTERLPLTLTRSSCAMMRRFSSPMT